MNELTKDELKNINAGGFSFGIGIAIGAGLIFIIGLIDGYVRPLACN